jgi:hypothetical protein
MKLKKLFIVLLAVVVIVYATLVPQAADTKITVSYSGSCTGSFNSAGRIVKDSNQTWRYVQVKVTRTAYTPQLSAVADYYYRTRAQVYNNAASLSPELTVAVSYGTCQYVISATNLSNTNQIHIRVINPYGSSYTLSTDGSFWGVFY